MANIVVITVVLALSYWMATEATYEDMKGQSLCHYTKTKEDCDNFGECLKQHNYTVSDPCNCTEVHAAKIPKDKLASLMFCSWKRGGLINEDGSCNTELQMDIIKNKMTFNSTDIKDDLIKAVEKCNVEYKTNCTADLLCATKESFQICLPNVNFNEEYKPDE